MKTTKASDYQSAKEIYASLGVDTEKAISKTLANPISLQCWQGDDVGGFERDASLSGGIAVTGNYMGKARTIDELRADAEFALKLIPGKNRFSLHAIYGDFKGKAPERNKIEPKHFESWVKWAKKLGIGLDFNPTFFSHPLAAEGFTLSHPDKKVRNFWIEHAIASRKIGEYIGKSLKDTTCNNIWVPDGLKDTPADRLKFRENLKDSLDKILSVNISKKYNLDAVESKLFGIGSESYVVGSHEFYMGYAVKNQIMLCLDSGHFHPTETISDKISSALLFVPDVLLHVSRGVRWDSDHVVLFNDDTKAIFQEIVRYGFEKRVHVGLDFFDASINRIAAWVVGARNTKKAMLSAYLEPQKILKEAEKRFDFTTRLAISEEAKSLPFGAVWDELCRRAKVSADWFEKIEDYEQNVLAARK